MISVIPFVVRAVTAYQEHRSAADFLAWQQNVSESLSDIRSQLGEIARSISRLQESIDALPATFATILEGVEAGRVKGWRESAMETAASIRLVGPQGITPERVGALWVLAQDLAASEAAFESTWGYSSYCLVTESFLARVGLYRILWHKDPRGAAAAFEVAKARKLAWLDAGLSADSAATGPAKSLSDRRAYQAFAASLFDRIEGGSAIAIGWYEIEPAPALGGYSVTGNAANRHIKATQPRLVGNRHSAFSAQDRWELDSDYLAGPTPNWGNLPQNPWWPARRLNPTYTTSGSGGLFGAREHWMEALMANVRTYQRYESSIALLQPIVDDLRGIRDEIKKLTIS